MHHDESAESDEADEGIARQQVEGLLESIAQVGELFLLEACVDDEDKDGRGHRGRLAESEAGGRRLRSVGKKCIFCK